MVSNNTTSTITAADNTSYTLSNFFDTITATTATLSNNYYN